MKKKALLFPDYIVNELSRDANNNTGEEFFRLLSVFDEIYCDIIILKDFYAGFIKQFHKDVDIDSMIDVLLNENILINIPFTDILLKNIKTFNLPRDIEYDKIYHPRFGIVSGHAMLRRLHEKKIIAKSEIELMLETIKTHLIFSINNNYYPIYENPDLLLCLTNKINPEKIKHVKNKIKFKEISFSILSSRIPRFSFNSVNELKQLLEIREKGLFFFQNEISKYVSLFGGYIVNENDKSKLSTDITIAESNLSTIRELNLGKSFGKEIVIDIISHIFHLPLGTIKLTCEQLYQNKEIKDKNLQWIMYLQLLKNFQKENNNENSCELCRISVTEIEDLNDEKLFAIIGNMCIPHTVIYLNVRTFSCLIGKPLLKLVKELEKDPKFNFGIPP
jgi:hypothetical protein